MLLKLWERRYTATNIKFLRAYLIRAVKNEDFAYIEKLFYKREISCSLDIEISAPLEKAIDPETIAQQKELRKIILICIEELTPRQREIIDHIIDDSKASFNALGKNIGCSYQNMQSIICRVRVQFRKIQQLWED